jgi:CheY-like chemotaxis protein
MDIQMPIMNGYEATKAIRGSGREDLEKLPIIAMTADAFTDDVNRAKAAGMNGHVAKPIDVNILGKIIDECLNK